MKALEVKNITKRFPGILANDHINLSINKSEIYSIVGENGAGKSTLMKIIYGLYTQTSGEIYVFGEKVKINNSNDAIKLKIGMVHQEFMLIPRFSVTENIVLGQEPKRGIFFDRKTAVKEIKEISDRYGLKVDPLEKVENLPVGIQQRVEILKVLRRGAEILIFDEPTAVLTPEEAEDLFKTLSFLRDSGKTIIFISHKLKEVMAISDRIAVLRRGKLQGVVYKEKTNKQELARMMVGRDVVLEIPAALVKRGDTITSVRNLTVKNNRGIVGLKDVSFDVHSGEILGIAGVEGNGQAELIDALIGFTKPVSGSISLSGEKVKSINPHNMRERGMAYIPEDRKRRGLILPFRIKDNMIMGQHNKKPFSRNGILNDMEIDSFAEKKIEEFDVRPRDIYAKAANLSGGTQQKVLLARELSIWHNFILAAQPTRGLDIGAMEFVYKMLIEEKKRGIAVLLVSLELSEIMGLADRILVLYEGEIIGEKKPGETSEEDLGLMMLGLKKKEKVV